MSFDEIIVAINDVVWGIPLIILIIAVGILLTVRLKLLQITKLPKAFKFMFKDEEGGKGEVSSFGALCIALSATIGTGNIVGVATAIAAGGPGALFWMVVAAFFGMATKYAEGLLAVKYRTIDKDGHILGGPFYYIEKGLGKKFKWLAKLFAVFGLLAGLLGIGTITQCNGITDVVQSFADPEKQYMINLFGTDYSVAALIAGAVVTVFAALVIIGGIKRISKVSEIVVPFMAILYIVTCLILVLSNLPAIPAAFATIIEGAFNPSAVTGGVIGSMIVAMQKGVARGIFSNESGLGSAPIAAAAAKTNEPARQGLVSMTGTFIDTIIICTMTGLSIVLTGAWQATDAAGKALEGVNITAYAFDKGLWFLPESVTSFILMLCLAFFAFTTILGWNYYSERCLEYLCGKKELVLKIYKFLYIAAVFIAPYLTAAAVWNLADICNGLMAFPNLLALFLLSGVVAKETKDFIAREKFREKREKMAKAEE
ncbi:MAG: alanine:cation symporter family protein [Ruminococcaceae bacterium]|nr:alanine:cation symporter family protein [Oscillospiraceae bacterium]